MALSPRDRRAVLILGAAAGLALAFFLVTRLLGGDEGEVAAPPGPVAQVPESPIPEVSPTPRQTPPPVPAFSGRDPFSPPPVFASPGDGVSPSPTASPTESPTAPVGRSSRTVDGHAVVLLDLFTRNGQPMAQVEVDGTVYTVQVGQTFADDFELVSVSGNCARFLFGDESFTLCVSERK